MKKKEGVSCVQINVAATEVKDQKSDVILVTKLKNQEDLEV